jgi:SSS family solute:Na+ symporter
MLAQLRIDDRPLIYLVAFGFLVSLLAIGVVFRKFSANSRDYFCANGQAKWWLVGGSSFMQSFSAWTFTGAAGAAYAAGWSLVVMYGANILASATAALAAAMWFRRLRVTTPADTIRLRYGPGMEQLYSYLQLAAGLLFSSTQLLALAIFTSALLGFPVWAIIVALGVVVLFYTVLAGAWAVLAADFVQALVLVPVTMLLAYVCIDHFGGFAGLMDAIAAAGLERDFAPIKSLETVADIPGITAGYFTFGFFGAWYLNTTVQANSLGFSGKYLTVKDDREARKAAVFTAILATVAALVFFIPPMTARLLIPAEIAALGLPHPAEGAYAGIALSLLPTALVGMVLVAMCAATMSSLDGGLTGLAAIITQNAYPALCRAFGREPVEGRARLLLGRCANLGCALLVILLAIILSRSGSGGVFALLLDILAIVLAPVALPMALALWVRRVPRQTPFIAIVAGLVGALAAAFLPAKLGAEPWLYHHRIFAVAATGLIAFFGSRRLLGPLDAVTAAREAQFFALRDRPINFAQEVGAGNDSTQMRIMGCFAGALALAFLALLLPASSAGHTGKFLTLSGTCGTVCIVLLSLAHRRRVRPAPPVPVSIPPA